MNADEKSHLMYPRGTCSLRCVRMARHSCRTGCCFVLFKQPLRKKSLLSKGNSGIRAILRMRVGTKRWRCCMFIPQLVFDWLFNFYSKLTKIE